MRKVVQVTQDPQAFHATRPSLVDPVNFLFATRDTGYKSSSLAIAELVDNALQASAHKISITVSKSGPASAQQAEIVVVDDGLGMDENSLVRALTFGGTSRFNNRTSLGRYGMGLPNGALSRCRCVEVYTWQGQEVLYSRLDIDELAQSGEAFLPPIRQVDRPDYLPVTTSGTAVILSRCDRLEYKRVTTLARRLDEDLGRIYRHFITRGARLEINGHLVVASDPLCILPGSRLTGASKFGDELRYKIATEAGHGVVRVQFTEFPLEQWHALESEQKRFMGITAGPPVSIVRADREIDRGWFFMGDKRRENYDDWWRCEIQFEPVLDELFGITHSKQAISPHPDLLDVLAPDLEPIARALNARVQERFMLLRATALLNGAEQQAARAHRSLPPVPPRREEVPEELSSIVTATGRPNTPYLIRATELPGTAMYEVVQRGDQTLLLINTKHPWYRDLYGPLAMGDSVRDHDHARQLALSLLAAARAEAALVQRGARAHALRFRHQWSDVLATFMNA